MWQNPKYAICINSELSWSLEAASHRPTVHCSVAHYGWLLTLWPKLAHNNLKWHFQIHSQLKSRLKTPLTRYIRQRVLQFGCKYFWTLVWNIFQLDHGGLCDECGSGEWVVARCLGRIAVSRPHTACVMQQSCSRHEPGINHERGWSWCHRDGSWKCVDQELPLVSIVPRSGEGGNSLEI